MIVRYRNPITKEIITKEEAIAIAKAEYSFTDWFNDLPFFKQCQLEDLYDRNVLTDYNLNQMYEEYIEENLNNFVDELICSH